MRPEDTIKCWTNHLGIWMIDEVFFSQALMLFQRGLYQTRPVVYFEPSVEPESRERSGPAPYEVYKDTAILSLQGPLTKGESKFTGTSTLGLRRALRAAAHDKAIANILLHVDSPGGHVAGTQEAADEVYRINQIKPVHAHIDDLGASAAYWIASQASSISANPSAQVGSLGTMISVTDSSEAFAREGLKAEVISTGKFKGLGTPGTKLTKEGREYLQHMVNALNTHFMAGILRGRRGMTEAALTTVADGRTFIAEEALGYGLIDRVQSMDDAIGSMRYARAMSAKTELQAWLASHTG